MQIFIDRKEEKIELRYSGSVKGLLEKLKLNPEEYLVVRGSDLLTEDTQLSGDDKIKVLSVVSGG